MTPVPYRPHHNLLRHRDIVPTTTRRKNVKGPGRCIFCGGKGLTKQHVFGDRLRRLFPEMFKDMRTHAGFFSRDLVPSARFETARRLTQGAVFGKKVRVVCLRCNIGWMRRLEESAFPVITNLIKGMPLALEPVQQRAVATWLTQVAMTAEYFQPDGVLTPQLSRTDFMTSKLPPRGWQIWIGTYTGRYFQGSALHHASEKANFWLENNPTVQHSGNLHTTVFWIGALFAHVFYSEFPLFQLPVPKSGFVQLFPVINETVQWPLSPFLDGNVRDVIEGLKRLHHNNVDFF